MNFDKTFEVDEIKLKDQKVGKRFDINIIKLIKTKYGNNMILYNKKHNRVFFANSLLRAYLSKVIINLKHTDNYYYKDDDLSSILQFIITGKKEVNGKPQVQLEFIKSYNYHYDNEVLDLSDKE